MMSWIPIQHYIISMSSRVYTIMVTIPKESIMSVMINCDTMNTNLVEGWNMSVEIVEIPIFTFMHTSNTNI